MPAPILAVDGISKSFPGVRALDGVSFDVRAGEIHALVGENGAGKSTLMRILAGVHPPDQGRILLRDAPVAPRSPAEARRLGIAMVYQDTRLVPDLDGAQNIWLAREPGGAVLVDRAAMDRGARAILDRLGERIDLARPVGELPLAQRQVVEIARALAAEAAVLILDEPTSALTSGEVERLFAILRDLRARGTAIVFISHRLPEVLSLADRVSVLKDGRLVGTVAAAQTDTTRLVAMMVGREIAMAFPPRAAAPGAVRLAVEGLTAPGRFEDVGLRIRAGEIVGLAGIQGSGQQDIARALFGLVAAEGRIAIDGTDIRPGKPGDAIAAGLVYVPADRRGEGLFLPHSVRENIALPHLAGWSRLGLMPFGRERERAAGQIAALAIRTPSAERPVAVLSGGNQQKVVFARWFLSEPKIYVFDEPTQGVDVATKFELYRLIRGMADRGAAVLLLSSDVIELIGLSDRVLVVAEGRIVDEVAGAAATEERIVGSAVGGRGKTGSPLPPARHPRDSGDLVPSSARDSRFRGNDDKGRHWSDEGRKRATPRRATPLLRRYASSLFLLALILLIGAYTTSQSEYFLTQRNLANLAIQVAPLALVALGQMLVVLLGGIDLSVGPTMSLVTAVASFLIVGDAGGGAALGIAACIAVGAAVGVLNAALIQALRLPDLIATLATYSAVLGTALIVRPAPGGLVAEDFAVAMTARWGSVPVAFLVVLALYAVGELLLLRGRIGAQLYATGSSREAAYAAGVPVGRVRVVAYIACGVLAALAGLVIAARIGSGDPQAGTVFTLASITAVVVGGASIFGGRGSLVGTLLGAVLIILVQNALNQLHVSAYWQYVWTGALTLFAVAIYSLRDGRGGLPGWPAFRLATPSPGPNRAQPEETR